MIFFNSVTVLGAKYFLFLYFILIFSSFIFFKRLIIFFLLLTNLSDLFLLFKLFAASTIGL